MPMREILGIYAITPDESDTQRLVTQVGAALTGGIAAVQYRNKTANESLRREQARSLARLCRTARVPFIVNDHLQLAVELEADGLHLGAEDGDILDARRLLGPGRILGVSCYSSVSAALAAIAAGADYVAFGSMFESPTKPHAVRAPLSVFAQARAAGIKTPMVGIGGITLDNISTLVAAGAHAAAVIGALFGDGDLNSIQARAKALAARFPHGPDRHL